MKTKAYLKPIAITAGVCFVLTGLFAGIFLPLYHNTPEHTSGLFVFGAVLCVTVFAPGALTAKALFAEPSVYAMLGFAIVMNTVFGAVLGWVIGLCRRKTTEQ